MKKSSFVAMILGSAGGLFLAVGMCMVTLPAWNAFVPGIVFGCIGLAFLLITLIVWRRMTGKTPIRLTGKSVLTALIGILGALALGVGMCMNMVWSMMIPGVLIGILGIAMLLSLVPMVRGIK